LRKEGKQRGERKGEGERTIDWVEDASVKVLVAGSHGSRERIKAKKEWRGGGSKEEETLVSSA
jgi:hypothetical protein